MASSKPKQESVNSELKRESEIIYQNNLKTVDDFVYLYQKALTRYLKGRTFIGDGNKSHMVDLASEASAFAEVFFYTVDATTGQ